MGQVTSRAPRHRQSSRWVATTPGVEGVLSSRVPELGASDDRGFWLEWVVYRGLPGEVVDPWRSMLPG